MRCKFIRDYWMQIAINIFKIIINIMFSLVDYIVKRRLLAVFKNYLEIRKKNYNIFRINILTRLFFFLHDYLLNLINKLPV